MNNKNLVSDCPGGGGGLVHGNPIWPMDYMICRNLHLLEYTRITERSTCHGRVDTHGDNSTQHTRY